MAVGAGQYAGTTKPVAMPQELLDKVIAASKFNQGMLDQRWHRLPADQLPRQGRGGVRSRRAQADGIAYTRCRCAPHR
jgi:hypothetical protein